MRLSPIQVIIIWLWVIMDLCRSSASNLATTTQQREHELSCCASNTKHVQPYIQCKEIWICKTLCRWQQWSSTGQCTPFPETFIGKYHETDGCPYHIGQICATISHALSLTVYSTGYCTQAYYVKNLLPLYWVMLETVIYALFQSAVFKVKPAYASVSTILLFVA